MTAPRRTAEEDIAGLFRNLDLHARVHTLEQDHARIQNLEQQVLALQERVHALEVDNEALKPVRRGSTVPKSVVSNARDADHEMMDGISGDSPEHHSSALHSLVRQGRDESAALFEEELLSTSTWEMESTNGSPEHIPSPPRDQISPPLTDFTVWYENGTLHTNAPAHLLITASWTSLLTAFTTTSTYLTSLNRDWPSITRPSNCVRGIVQKGSSSSVWTVDSPGEFCCKRCFNTQRVCLKYNAVNNRLEALPLPKEVRDEDEFGVNWFVAEEGNLSNKGVYKGLWK